MDILTVIQELVKDTTKTGVTLFVKEIFGEQIEDLANLSKRKLKNLGDALSKIYEKLKGKGVEIEEKVQEIDPEILQPILEGIYIGHKDEKIREKWVNLLESAILGNFIQPIYIETLKLLSGVDANVLEIICDYPKNSNRLNDYELKVALQQKGIDITEEMIKDSLFNLSARDLCDVNNLEGKPRYSDLVMDNIYLSNFGKKFLYVVSGEGN